MPSLRFVDPAAQREYWSDGVLKELTDQVWRHETNAVPEKFVAAYSFSNTPTLSPSRRPYEPEANTPSQFYQAGPFISDPRWWNL